MAEIPKEVKEKLENVIVYLDSMIAHNEEARGLIKSEGKSYTLDELEKMAPITKPIEQAIIAYTNARQQLYDQFPELKPENPSEREERK